MGVHMTTLTSKTDLSEISLATKPMVTLTVTTCMHLCDSKALCVALDCNPPLHSNTVN